MPGVFVSYRRNDAGGWAGRLRDHLALRYVEDNVRPDVDDLTAGSDYLAQILENIAAADAVLIVTALARPIGQKTGKRLADRKDVNRARAEAEDRRRADARWRRSNAARCRLQDLSRAARAGVRRGAATLDDTLATVDILQSRYFAQLDGDPHAAAATAQQALTLLDEEMRAYAHDQTLQLFRGFSLKNLAMAQRDLCDMAGFESNLELAAKCFEVVQREVELQLANACTGAAAVPMLRGGGPKALDLIDHALALAPDHPYAKHDREEIRRFFGI